MYKLKTILILFFLLSLTGCPAPEYDHVIINESDSILEVEYEYAMMSVKYDSSQVSNPAKTNLEQYEKEAKNWITFSPQNEYQLESAGEETITTPNNERSKQEIKRINLKLLPNEVLRVFVSAHINFDLKNLRKISLRGENGKLEIEGAGFEQFAAYRPGGFFTSTKDYRLVYH